MNRRRYSYIAHGRMKIWNPLQSLEFADVANGLTIPKGARILDIGCGRGHWLIRIAESFDIAFAIGVDTSPFAVEAAMVAAAKSIAQDRITIVEGEFDPAAYGDETFDLILCIGATHAISNFKDALGEAYRLLRPGAQLLVGEGYWKRPPDPAYLAFLQCGEDLYTSSDGNCRHATELGYEVIWKYECSDLEWSAYENQYAQNIEEYVASHPDDLDSEQMLSTVRAWHNHFVQFGHDTLGFGLYLLSRK